MPPPYRRNPVADAEADFFGEQQPPRFFGNVGQGRTAFGSYISPRLASNLQTAAQRADLEDDMTRTRMDENAFQRMRARSGARILPFTEAANISQAQLSKDRAESDLRLNPFAETERQAEMRLHAAQAQSGLENLPKDVEARNIARDIGVERLQSEDPMMERLARFTKNPAHLVAYDHFLATAPKELVKPLDRQRYAHNQSLRLAQDEDAAAAVYEAYAEGRMDDAALADILESVDSPDGQHFGMRVKPEARGRVNAMMAQSRMRRANLAEQREARVAQTAHDAQLLRTLDDQISDYRKAAETDDSVKDKLKKSVERREMIVNRMMGDGAKDSAPESNPVDESEKSRLLR